MSEFSLALALGAGMLAAVNPCGFALLPGYVAMLAAEPASSRGAAVLRALGLAAAMTLGFTLFFGAFGLLLGPAAGAVQRHLPWAAVVLGAAMALLGVWLLAGKSLPGPNLRLAPRRRLRYSWLSMTGFGAGYAAASLSCTVAPFLATVVAAFDSGSAAGGTLLFVAYAAGMGSVVTTVALAAAASRERVATSMKRAAPALSRLGGALLLFAGAYVAYYGVYDLRFYAGGSAEDPVVAAARTVQSTLAEAVRFVGPGGFAIVALVLAGVAILPLRRFARRLTSLRIARSVAERTPPRLTSLTSKESTDTERPDDADRA